MIQDVPLRERYRLREILGRGGFAVTYLADDERTGKRCVVKQVSLGAGTTAKDVDLLLREARVLAQISYPRIPAFVDFFAQDEADGQRQAYLVQDYVPGRSLADLVTGGRHFTEAEALRIARQVADVLAYLHGFSPPVIHRDIKPSNVVLDDDGAAHLIDFGAVARLILWDAERRGGGSTVVGTYGYMPFEQFEGRAVPASDIYALGATLVFLLSHREPHQLEKAGMRLDFRPHVNISAGFAQVLERMLDPDWRRRYQSAGELRAALDGVGVPLASRPVGWAVTLGLAGVLALAGLGVYGLRPVPPQLQGWEQEALPNVPGEGLPRGALLRIGTTRLRHGLGISVMAFSPDGKVLASGSLDNSVSLWDVASGKELRRMSWSSNYQTEPHHLVFSPDGKRLAAGLWDESARIWDVASGEELQRLGWLVSNNVDERLNVVAFSPDGKLLAGGGYSSAIRIWDTGTGRPVRDLRGHERPVDGLAFGHDGRTLMSWSKEERRLVLWDHARGVARLTRVLGEDSAYQHAFSPDGRLLAITGNSAHTQMRTRLWNTYTGRLHAEMPDTGCSQRMIFSADGTRLACASYSGYSVWSVPDLRPLQQLRDHQNWPMIALSPDGSTLAAASGSAIRLWDATEPRPRHLDPWHSGRVVGLAFTPDGRRLVTGSSDKSAVIWDIGSGEYLQKRFWEDGEVLGAALSPDGRIAATGYWGAVYLWDPASGKLLRQLKGVSGPLAFSPDGRALAALSQQDRSVRVLAVETGEELAHTTGNKSPVRALAFSPRGDLLASGGEDNQVRVWDAATGQERHQLAGHTYNVMALAFSPDGRALASGGMDRQILLWDPYRGQRLARLPEQQQGVMALAYAPDGRVLASGNEDRTVRLWEPATGRQLLKLNGHRGPVASLAFAADGRRLASGSTDTSILIWEMPRF